MNTWGAANGGSTIACLTKVKRPTRHRARKASISDSVRTRYMLAASKGVATVEVICRDHVSGLQCFRKATQPFVYSHSKVAITLPPGS